MFTLNCFVAHPLLHTSTDFPFHRDRQVKYMVTVWVYQRQLQFNLNKHNRENDIIPRSIYIYPPACLSPHYTLKSPWPQSVLLITTTSISCSISACSWHTWWALLDFLRFIDPILHQTIKSSLSSVLNIRLHVVNCWCIPHKPWTYLKQSTELFTHWPSHLCAN